MDFTNDFWIGLVLGAFVGFIICRLVKWSTTSDRDEKPH
jgi:hypothetical protein